MTMLEKEYYPKMNTGTEWNLHLRIGEEGGASLGLIKEWVASC